MSASALHRKEKPRKRTRAALTTLGVAGVAAAIVATGSVVNASAAVVPTITLNVDGDLTTLTTAAPTVGDVVASQSIRHDSNDLVSPSVASTVQDGMTITVDHRVEVTVDTAAATTSHIVQSETVNQLKQELNLPSADASAVRLSRSAASNWKRTIVTRPNGQRLRGTQPVVENSVAVVQQVHVGYIERTKTLRHSVRRKSTPLLPAGTVRVQRVGHDGRARLTLKRTFLDGTFATREVVKRDVRRSKVNRVVLRGTGPNWLGLAQCESGNSLRAVNPAGFYGLYQFSLGTWRGVGGAGNPIDASRMEQTRRAWILFQRSGRSPWPVCGVHL